MIVVILLNQSVNSTNLKYELPGDLLVNTDENTNTNRNLNINVDKNGVRDFNIDVNKDTNKNKTNYCNKNIIFDNQNLDTNLDTHLNDNLNEHNNSNNNFIKTLKKSMKHFDTSNEKDNFYELIKLTEYKHKLYVPAINGLYEKDLALALLEVSFATTQLNINRNVILPTGFTNYKILEGTNPLLPISNILIGCIFWNDNQAIFSFSGTSTIPQIILDLDFNQTVAEIFINDNIDVIKCHSGFYSIYMAGRNQLIEWWKEHNSHIDDIFITGHSLGGSVSSICALDFTINHIKNIDIKLIHYSFGSPRVGNNAYALLFNTKVPQSIRVANTEDIIVTLPPATIGSYRYEHTGGLVSFTASLGSFTGNHSTAYILYMPSSFVSNVRETLIHVNINNTNDNNNDNNKDNIIIDNVSNNIYDQDINNIVIDNVSNNIIYDQDINNNMSYNSKMSYNSYNSDNSYNYYNGDNSYNYYNGDNGYNYYNGDNSDIGIYNNSLKYKRGKISLRYTPKNNTVKNFKSI